MLNLWFNLGYTNCCFLMILNSRESSFSPLNKKLNYQLALAKTYWGD